MRIVFVFSDETGWNCSEWRCVIPAKAINLTGQHQAKLLDIKLFASSSKEAVLICDQADVIVVQRNLFGDVPSAIQHWKAQGKIIVADIDDAYQLTDPSNISYPFWIEGKYYPNGPDKPVVMEPPPLIQFKWGLRMVHAISAPSKLLCADWRSLNETVWMPNYIDAARYVSVPKIEHEGIVIGWGGSVSHVPSWQKSGLITALKRVCKARPQVKVMVCGDKRVADLLSIPDKQKVFVEFTPAAGWYQTMANFDIGLAPLAGEYDRRRSWIKAIEYMVNKIPWIASRSDPYIGLESYGKLVDNTPIEWEAAIMGCVDNLEYERKLAADKPYQFGVHQDINRNVSRIIDAYRAICHRNGKTDV